MENTFRPSRFLSLRATTPSPCTWEEIMQELTGERHAAVTALFRALAAGEGKTPKRQNGSKARSSRTNPPSSLPSTWREDAPRSTSKAIRAPSWWTSTASPKRSSTRPRTGKGRPALVPCLQDLSGRGIRVIAWMEGEVTEENFPAAWQTVNAYYARLTGIAIDRQCKNATRMPVICHDPDALYRPDAERMKLLPARRQGRTKQDIAAGKKHRGGDIGRTAPKTPYAGLWKKRACTTQPAATTTTSAGAST